MYNRRKYNYQQLKFKEMKKLLFMLVAAVLLSVTLVSCSKSKSKKDVKIEFSITLVGEPTSDSFTVQLSNIKNIEEAKYILQYEGVDDFSKVLTPEYIFQQGTVLPNFNGSILFNSLPSNCKFKIWIAGRNAKGGAYANSLEVKTKP